MRGVVMAIENRPGLAAPRPISFVCGPTSTQRQAARANSTDRSRSAEDFQTAANNSKSEWTPDGIATITNKPELSKQASREPGGLRPHTA